MEVSVGTWRLLVLACLAGGLAGCQRPEAVRRVATASEPVVLRLQQAGPRYQKRFELQRQAFDALAAEQVRLAGDARAEAASIERGWRMAGRDADLKRLAVLREEDAVIRDNPTGSAPAAQALGEAGEIDQSDLKKSLAALELLKGKQRMNWWDLVAFGQSVADELEKVAKESAPAPKDTGATKDN
jgi:hypothetical protein